MPILTKGFPEIERKLKTLQKFQAWATPAIELGVDAMYKRATTYAPDFPGNSYARTGRLGRSMAKLIRSNNRGVTGTVYGTGASAPHGVDYTGLVKVEGSQAAIHARHGWKTDKADLEESRADIDAALDNAVKKALRK